MPDHLSLSHHAADGEQRAPRMTREAGITHWPRDMVPDATQQRRRQRCLGAEAPARKSRTMGMAVR